MGSWVKLRVSGNAKKDNTVEMIKNELQIKTQSNKQKDKQADCLL